MAKPTVIEMIEAVKDKYGENQAFDMLGIDRTTYYNYRKGGNPNRKKFLKIQQVFNELSANRNGSPGNGGEKNNPAEEQDYRSKYIALLETQLQALRDPTLLNSIEKRLADLQAQILAIKVVVDESSDHLKKLASIGGELFSDPHAGSRSGKRTVR
jgi:hypothetical protein